MSGYAQKLVTLTGNAIKEKGVEELSTELLTILEKYMTKPTPPSAQAARGPGSYLSDASVITKASPSKQDEKSPSL